MAGRDKKIDAKRKRGAAENGTPTKPERVKKEYELAGQTKDTPDEVNGEHPPS